MGRPLGKNFGVPSPPLWAPKRYEDLVFPPQILDLDPGGPRKRAARTLFGEPEVPVYR